jgi:hypothetical protein
VGLVFNLIDDPDRRFTTAEASIIAGCQPETMRRWAASGRIASFWLEAIAEYRVTAAAILQIREEGPGPEGQHQPTFVHAPKDVTAQIRKLKRHTASVGGTNGARP